MGKEEPNGFGEFWSVYPRHRAKQAAMKAYARALKATTAEEILCAAKKYAVERYRQDERYTAHAATWLNAGCWGDYAVTPTTVSNAMPGFYVSFASTEMEHWIVYELRTGKSFPRDKRGGWTFPTRWPPGHQEQAA